MAISGESIRSLVYLWCGVLRFVEEKMTDLPRNIEQVPPNKARKRCVNKNNWKTEVQRRNR